MGHILLVAFSLNPRWGSEPGYAAQWLEVMLPRYRVEVITDVEFSDDLGANRYGGVKFHFVDGVRRWKRFAARTGLVNIATAVFFCKVRRTIEWLGVDGIDAIHCITPAGIFAHNDLYRFGVPLVVGPLGGGLATPKGFDEAFRYQMTKSWLRELYYRYSLRRSGGVRRYLSSARVAVAGLGVSRQLLAGMGARNVVTIPDVLVDTDFFRPADRVAHGGPVRVLFAGRLASNKGPLLLLDAIEACLRRGEEGFVVEIAGSGPLQRELEKEIKQKRLGQHVSLIGALLREELRRKYQQSDIFCLPTLREPGGVAILEAMSCGLPVITSNYGGPSVSVTEECGVKIEVVDYGQYVGDLADALLHLIRNGEVRRRMGRAGRERAKREYSVSALKHKVEALYEGVIGNSSEGEHCAGPV